MRLHLEYDLPVQRSIPASVAAFALLTLPLVFIASAYAQMNGASVTSAPSHMVTGAVPSPTGPVRPPTGTVPNVNSLVPNKVISRPASGNHPHHHRSDVGPVWYAVPVPYPVDGSAYSDADADNSNENDTDNYQGGPTVFDRRGDGADSYVPPVDDPSPHAADRAQSEVANADAPQLTTLVFKDGHKLEVVNYAIVGSTLFDMTPGHARKVPLADLDLEATREQNEEQGVTFQLPMSSQAN